MDTVLIYSDKCKNSVILKKFSVFNKLNKLNVNNANERKNIPNYVKTVPTLVITKNGDISILKNNDLLMWFKMNSDRNIDYNKHTSNNNSKVLNVSESNTLINSDFSSNYSFIEDGGDNLLETYYSNINNDCSIYTPEQTQTGGHTKNSSGSSLDNDYEQLMNERNKDFKPIERH